MADSFVQYALGDSDYFPHANSVSMAIGGYPVVSVDDFHAAITNRVLWKQCSADWEVYGASSCPVDILGPIKTSALRDAVIVYSSHLGTVTCAPTRTGPLPPGRLVVLRPTPEWRTCATDFALALVADPQGRLRHVDLTLAAP